MQIKPNQTSALTWLLLSTLLIYQACSENAKSRISIEGTWQLISGTTITKGVAEVTDYTAKQEMIKIINANHFAFLKHDLNAPKDSSNHFDAGGGRYVLVGDQYTEYLDYYNDPHWEGKSFSFTLSMQGDTLVQKGMEKVEQLGIEREIIEKYIRVKK